MRRLLAPLLALGLLLAAAGPSTASTYDLRCSALVTQVNQERTRTDLRLQSALCIIGRERAAYFGRINYATHSGGISYAIKRLRDFGFSYRWGGDFCGIGEVIGWTTWSFTYASQYADHFAKLWRASPTHWSILNGSSYQRAGGNMVRDGSRMYAVFYAIDRTC